MGAQVKKTVTSRKERLPHTSDNAPISGADMNDSRPLMRRQTNAADEPHSGTVREATVSTSSLPSHPE